MDKLNEVICKLCLETTNYGNFKLIDEFTKKVMDVLQLQQNLNVKDNSVICNECSEKLFTAFHFKVMCINTEDRLFPYIILKSDTELDLKYVYLKEMGNEDLNSTTKDRKVCRLCMQLIVSDSMSVEDLQSNMIEIYIPEVNFCCTKYPVLCERCFKSIIGNSIFLKKCLEMEERMKYISSGDKVYVKTEEIEIKTEESHEDGSYEELKNKQSKHDVCPTKVPDENHITVPNVREGISEELFKIYKCKQCDFGCMYKSDLTKHELTHRKPFKCDQCKYETYKRKYYNRHVTIHKDRSDMPLYKCEKCDFESMYKSRLTIHLLRHKDVSEVEKYQCDKCEYITIFKAYYSNHQRTHKSPSELKMHKCSQCSFETKHRRCFVRHMVKHKDSFEVRMFKCDICDFETRHSNSFSTHQVKHKDCKELEMFRCDNCAYETKRKVYLIRHQLTHRKPSEVEMYKCGECSFQTKHKCSLQRHQTRHQ